MCPSAIYGLVTKKDNNFNLKRQMVGFNKLPFPVEKYDKNNCRNWMEPYGGYESCKKMILAAKKMVLITLKLKFLY